MLEDVYNLFKEKYKDSVKSWDQFIEFIAADNNASLIYQLNDKLEWLFEDKRLLKSLMTKYNPALLRSDYYDHLGDMYFEKILKPGHSQNKDLFLISMNDAYDMIKKTIGENDAPIKILDPNVGTGRYLMAAHKIVPNALLFGVDSDLRALRIVFTNFTIHSIPGYLLHADTSVHDIEMETDEGIYNWQFANEWNSCIEKLKAKKRKIKDKITEVKKTAKN